MLGMRSKFSGKFAISPAILYPYKIALPPPPCFYLVRIFPIFVTVKHHKQGVVGGGVRHFYVLNQF